MGETLEQLGGDLAQGRITSESLVRDRIARIEAENPALLAFTDVFGQQALEAARQRDDELRRGLRRGPLHGIPLAVKNLADVEGCVTRFGSRVYGSAPSRRNAVFVQKLADAGAVIVGTTHMVEFAIGSWGTNHVLGTPWNPLDRSRHRVPGGSSSGSAVAVAAALVPAAIGSDTGGSVRIPASLCGVVGFKPSYGAVSNEGVAPLAPSFDTIGPIVRSVADARLVHDVIADVPAGTVEVDPSAIRIGLVDGDQLAPMDTLVAQSFAEAGALIAGQCGLAERFRFPQDMTSCQQMSGEIMAHEAYRHLARLVDDGRRPMDPFVRERVRAGRAVSDERYHELLRMRQAMIHAFEPTFASFDFLVMPTTPRPAIPLDEVDEALVPMSRFTRPANLLNLCAISIPVRAGGGLPAGLQIVGKAGDDARLLGFAAHVEAMLAGAAAR